MQQGRPAIAVFGAGRIGRVHAANVAAGTDADFVGIADVDALAAKQLIERLGRGRVASVEEFLEDPAVDGVVIATPSDTHPALIHAAARAKKAIFCEKPISLDVGTTISAIQVCEEAGVPMQIGFQRRFDRDFVNAKAAIESGKIGEVRYIRLVGRDRALPPIAYIRTSGGQYKDQMVHDFDAARWLLEPAQVEEVTAAGSALIDPAVADAGDVDTAVVCLRFTNGTLAVIEASREAVYGYDARSEIHGSGGLLLSGYEMLRNGEVLDASHLSAQTDSFITRFSDAYRSEMQDFIDVAARRKEPRVGGRDALAALRIAIAADRARATKCTVQLADIEGAQA